MSDAPENPNPLICQHCGSDLGPLPPTEREDLQAKLAFYTEWEREATKLAKRALSFDCEPRPPSGGLQVGMQFVVSQRDWFRLVRLARWFAGREDS